VGFTAKYPPKKGFKMKTRKKQKDTPRWTLKWPTTIAAIMISTQLTVNAGEIVITPGYNQIAYPVDPPAGQTCGDLADQLDVEKISRFDPVSQTFSHCTSGQAAFPIVPGEGYITITTQAKTLPLPNIKNCPEIALETGVNLIAIPTPLANTGCHQLIEKLGNPTEVASVQQFDNSSGRFKSCQYQTNQPQGDNFTIDAEHSYLVHMRQTKTALQLNDLNQCNTTPITCDQSITATIEQAAEDNYVFNVKSPLLAELRLEDTGGEILSSLNKNATATLISPTGEEIQTLEANISQKIEMTTAGNYLIKVTANDGNSTGSYRLGMNCILPPLPRNGN